GNVCEDGGDCVIAFAKGPFLGRETADHEACFASLKSFLDVATHFPELLLVDDGTHVTCLIERILALPGESHRRNNSIDNPILVWVGEDDRGALAAKFERHRHDAVRGSAHNELADLRRAGEGELAYHRVVGERSATFLAEPSQHVEHARRQEFLTYFSEHQDAERCILCGLQDERVAGAKRGADLQSSQ